MLLNSKKKINAAGIFSSVHVIESTLRNGVLPDGLSNAATAVVESLKINVISERTYRGRPMVIKRRNPYGAKMADMTNLYFRLAKLPIRYLSDLDEWRRWEVGCFLMLNGDRYRAAAARKNAVRLDKIPGRNLWDHMKQGTLTRHMLQAAGREIHRAHQFWSDKLSGRWSHGDASMPNVIFEEGSGRARLIDFEIRHDESLPVVTRQADDLLVFLLDMVGNISSRHWLPFTTSFLRAYGDADVIAELRKQLVIPSGLALLWWNVRTNFAKSATVARRLTSLRKAIGQLDLYPLASGARRRQKRRPSKTCQTRSAGTPTAKSRTRASREIAKAVPPGMPSRLPMTR